MGHVSPEDGTIKVAVKTGVDDQFPSLSAFIFGGRNTRSLPFDSVNDLMGSLEDLSLNQARATASARLAGGSMTTRSKSYNQAFRSQQFGGVMSVEVEVDPFEDEAEEFGKVYEIMRSQGGFGRNKNDPPFYVSFNSRGERDAARRAYGNLCLLKSRSINSLRNAEHKYCRR